MTSIKNQGKCGSGWSFSAIANIEGQNYLKKDIELRNFSEQQLIDCDTQNKGCDSGLATNAFNWLSDNIGLELVINLNILN